MKASSIRSMDYTPSPADITDEDIYLIQNPKDHPKEADKSRSLFFHLTGVQPERETAEKVLKDLLSKGDFEYFEVRRGWKTEKVWRKLGTLPETLVALSPLDISQEKFVLIQNYVDFLKKKSPSIDCFKNKGDLLWKAVYIAQTKFEDDIQTSKKKAEYKITTTALPELTIKLVKSIRAIKNKEEIISIADKLAEEFLNGE